MSKRSVGVKKHEKSKRSHKTKKRLETKRLMLESQKGKRKRK